MRSFLDVLVIDDFELELRQQLADALGWAVTDIPEDRWPVLMAEWVTSGQSAEVFARWWMQAFEAAWAGEPEPPRPWAVADVAVVDTTTPWIDPTPSLEDIELPDVFGPTGEMPPISVTIEDEVVLPFVHELPAFTEATAEDIADRFGITIDQATSLLINARQGYSVEMIAERTGLDLDLVTDIYADMEAEAATPEDEATERQREAERRRQLEEDEARRLLEEERAEQRQLTAEQRVQELRDALGREPTEFELATFTASRMSATEWMTSTGVTTDRTLDDIAAEEPLPDIPSPFPIIPPPPPPPPTPEPAPELTRYQRILIGAAMLMESHYSGTGEGSWDDMLLGPNSMLYRQEYAEFTELFADLEAGEMDSVINRLVTLSQDPGRAWMFDAMRDMITTEYADYAEQVHQQVDEQIGQIGHAESLELRRQEERQRWARIFLGRDLTDEERTIIRSLETMDAATALVAPDLARAYFFFESGGLASNEREARLEWQRFMENPDVPDVIKAEFADFTEVWRNYENFAYAAFNRARDSEAYTDVVNPDDLVPFSVWDFEDYVGFQSAVVAVQFNVQLGIDVELTPLQQLLQEHGISPAAVALFQQAPGEAYTDYYQRVLATLSQDEEFADLLVGIGAVTPSPSALLEDIAPEALATVRRAFLPRVAPEYRATFEEQLQIMLPNLWTRFEQITGPLAPSTDELQARQQIMAYQQQFTDYVRQLDFTRPEFISSFPMLTQQQQEQREEQRYRPTQIQKPQRFGVTR